MNNILVIRRDNIGDLVCTTPLLAALKARYPQARIAALVNSYNAPVLQGNPDVDEVLVYTKAKHRPAGQTVPGTWWRTWRLIRHMQAVRWDAVFVATAARAPQALKFARRLDAVRRIGYGRAADGLTDPLPPPEGDPAHECELVMRLLSPLLPELSLQPGPLRVFADPARVARLRPRLADGRGPLLGLHISARKVRQRWPVEHFAALARRLVAQADARLLLFWSPGDEDDARHPGDDRAAARLQQLCAGLPLLPMPSAELADLMAGLSLCDGLICSDGGAMHLAAGLGKPMVCFFGNSPARRWHPWGVPHRLLQAASENVGDISVEQALNACLELSFPTH